MLCFDVDLQVTEAVCTVGAVRAVKGLLSCVCHHVVVKVLLLVAPVEQLAAYWAYFGDLCAERHAHWDVMPALKRQNTVLSVTCPPSR